MSLVMLDIPPTFASEWEEEGMFEMELPQRHAEQLDLIEDPDDEDTAPVVDPVFVWKWWYVCHGVSCGLEVGVTPLGTHMQFLVEGLSEVKSDGRMEHEIQAGLVELAVMVTVLGLPEGDADAMQNLAVAEHSTGARNTQMSCTRIQLLFAMEDAVGRLETEDLGWMETSQGRRRVRIEDSTEFKRAMVSLLVKASDGLVSMVNVLFLVFLQEQGEAPRVQVSSTEELCKFRGMCGDLRALRTRVVGMLVYAMIYWYVRPSEYAYEPGDMMSRIVEAYGARADGVLELQGEKQHRTNPLRRAVCLFWRQVLACGEVPKLVSKIVGKLEGSE